MGLDPDLPRLPAQLSRDAASARDFLLRIIDATADLVCAFKPNSAFFEALGGEGFAVLRHVIAAARAHAPVILDAKRGDVGHTSEAYAAAAFQFLGADAITVSPYLGSDAVRPFLSDPSRGAFLLCATSNPSADEVQMIDCGEPLYERVARLGVQWDPHGQLGFVVGATRAERVARVRAIVGDRLILLPGVGAQGGDLERSVRAGKTPRGGVIVNVSRSVLYASPGTDFAQAARMEADRARARINEGMAGDA